MKFSFAITAWNEDKELDKLLTLLVKEGDCQNEIIVLLDKGNTSNSVKKVCERHKQHILLGYHPLNKNFAAHKNYLNSMCRGQYIFNIDADEIPEVSLVNNLHLLVNMNDDVDLIRVPRINVVNGITPMDMKKWGWTHSSKGWINFPDYQDRIYKNNGTIKWSNQVHEKLSGYKTVSKLPPEAKWSLIHTKTIKKQREQNKFYSEIIKGNKG